MICQFRTINRALRVTAALLPFCLAVSACGGGGGVGSTPPPPPAPTPPPPPPPPPPPSAIIPAATTTQEFITQGVSATRSTTSVPLQDLTLASDQQIRIRYDGPGQYYEVQLPGSSTWERLNGSDGDFETISGAGFSLNYSLRGLFTYSAIAGWRNAEGTIYGTSAVGIPTPSGAVPTSGSATYAGYLVGASNETTVHALSGTTLVAVTGTIQLAFDFGAGTLSGSASPILSYNDQTPNLPTLTFTNTVYSSGSTSFSGRFATSLTGLNTFSGRFTGPAAQELIGSFAFPYSSPVNGQVYGAAGALIAKKSQ